MLKRKFNESLRFRFLCVLVGGLFFAILLRGLIVTRTLESMLHDFLEVTGQSVAFHIGKLSKEALIMKSSIQLDAIVDDANKDENIAYNVIYDEQGVPLTSRFASFNYRLPIVRAILLELSRDRKVPDIIEAIKKTKRIVEVSIPITVGVKTIGTVTIGMSGFKMHQNIVRSTLYIMLLNVGGACILGGLLYVASQYMVFGPIIELARASSRLSRGDLSTTVKIKTTGEVKTLVDSFNQMVRNLEKVTVSRDYVDNIMESMINTLIVVSPDNKIASTNAATCSLLGYEEKELIGRSAETIFSGEKSNRDSWMKILLAEGRVANIEELYRTKDGRAVPVLLSASVIRIDNVLQGRVFVAQDITERQQAEEELRKSEQRLRFLASQLLTAHEKERQQLSWELQEDLAQNITALKMELRTFEPKLPADNEKLRQDYHQALEKIDGIITNLRQRAMDLSPQMLADLGLNAGLNTLCESYQMGCLCDLDDLTQLFTQDDQVNIYRIFQEALNNVRLHAQASQVALSVKKTDDRVDFLMEDNGQGFDVGKMEDVEAGRKGIGLAAMSERVRALGGTFKIESQIGVGTRIFFSIPKTGK
jgi:PAS domain S-box-containing protein